jgi:hypothetical protein
MGVPVLCWALVDARESVKRETKTLSSCTWVLLGETFPLMSILVGYCWHIKAFVFSYYVSMGFINSKIPSVDSLRLFQVDDHVILVNGDSTSFLLIFLSIITFSYGAN